MSIAKGAVQGLAALFASAVLSALIALIQEPDAGEGEVLVEVSQGTTVSGVAAILDSTGLIRHPRRFVMMARIRGLDRSLRAGVFSLRREDSPWDYLVALTQGGGVTRPTTFPEGLTLKEMAGRVGRAAGVDSAAALAEMSAPGAGERWGAPGPGLEGYLFPDTYRFVRDVGVDAVLETMIRRYRRYWTEDRRRRLSEIGMSERELVALASIIQAEAGDRAEMPTIASVYHNRLRIGMPLQADPTVVYALGARRPRLTYPAMDSVANHPYNTYTHPGLPPGPIGAPGRAALDAALHPSESPYLFFVASGDGGHVFSRSLREHNNARRRLRGSSQP